MLRYPANLLKVYFISKVFQNLTVKIIFGTTLS